MPEQIRIDGLAELRRSLKQIDTDAPKRIRLVANDAAQIVVDHAKPKIPRKTGKAAASIKLRSSQLAVRVAVGGRAAPYYPGLDFGGGRPQFPPYRAEGRFLYPSLKETRGQVTDKLAEGLTALATATGLDVT